MSESQEWMKFIICVMAGVSVGLFLALYSDKIFDTMDRWIEKVKGSDPE
mgnify:CR=1 FL=1